VKSLKWKNIITEGDKTRVEILQYKTKQPLYLPTHRRRTNEPHWHGAQ
jgi:hypothetical protein